MMSMNHRQKYLASKFCLALNKSFNRLRFKEPVKSGRQNGAFEGLSNANSKESKRKSTLKIFST